MKPVNSIDRSFQNQRNEVVETDVPKSGDNLSYRNHLGGLVLGRLYPQSIQHVMPNEKFSGSNEANLTFEQLSTPVIDDVDVCVHNFFVTLRSIDNRWEKFMTPTKLNNMNKNVSVPTFDTKLIYQTLLKLISDCCTNITTYTSGGVTYGKFTFALVNFDSIIANLWDNVYHTDALLDLREQLLAITGATASLNVDTVDSDTVNKFKLIFTTIFDFFVGKRSLLDYLGYITVTHDDIDEYFDIIPNEIRNYNSDTVYSWFINDGGSTLNPCFLFGYNSDDDIYDFASLPSIIQNEYALRAYYAIWFEYYRNYDLEPRSVNLPEYRDFGSGSIFGVVSPYGYLRSNLHYLVPRIRSWQQDAFITAGIDDISRHVYAPITNGGDSALQDDTSLMPSVLGNTLVNQSVTWRNPNTGSVATIEVPMPARLLSTLSTSDVSEFTYGVELFSLKKAQMLENYLKRIYYGGDEYRDRMLHIYGARIEDYRINRPEWLSSSLDTINIRQEVANTGVAPGSSEGWSAGSRLATATAVQSGSDGFTQFSSEFGVYISLLSIMPHATYDPYLLQNKQVAYTDFPIPQFANQMEDVISTIEISRKVPHTSFGYAPYGHAYRYRVDEVHGDFHDEKYDYVFFRFFNAKNIPNLSWSFIHCRPKLPMFVNSVLLDGQVYGTFKHNFLVEHPLPSPVEYI